MLEEISRADEEERDNFLADLGADIGAAQREGYLYNNLAEQLKDFAFSHGDDDANELADRLVDRLSDWGFASAEWEETQGGPPKPRSPRGWRRVLSWFLDKVAQVGEFLINAIDAFIQLCAGVAGASAVSVEVSMPPGVGFEFDVQKLIGSGQGSGPLREFARAMFGELRKSPFT